MTRTFRCEGCAREFPGGSRGPLPRRCGECDPEATRLREKEQRRHVPATAASLARELAHMEAALMASRRKRSGLTRRLNHIRGQVDAARQVYREALEENAALKAQLRAGVVSPAPPLEQTPRGGHMHSEARFDAVETRARRLGPPGSDAVRKGLRMLSFAEGASQTAERALDLAAALEVWAWVLTSSDNGRLAGGPLHPDSIKRRERERARAA